MAWSTTPNFNLSEEISTVEEPPKRLTGILWRGFRDSMRTGPPGAIALIFVLGTVAIAIGDMQRQHQLQDLIVPLVGLAYLPAASLLALRFRHTSRSGIFAKRIEDQDKEDGERYWLLPGLIWLWWASPLLILFGLVELSEGHWAGARALIFGALWFPISFWIMDEFGTPPSR